jgi:hypothetical protein
VPHLRLTRARLSVLAIAALVAAAFAGPASGALVEVDNLVLRADGGFHPQLLPRRQYAPIDFEGYVDISAKDGGKPAALRQALIDFDRDGRLDVTGLPTCSPEAIANASVEEARRICRGSIVGSGHIEALVSLSSGTVPASSLLTIFNGLPLNGRPTAILHAQFTVPATQTYAIVVPIERRRGEFRYRARIEVPPLAGGRGALTHLDVKIGRRYRAGGQKRSYVSARCSDSILSTHGRFFFEDGTIIDGQVEKYCRAK